MSGHTLRESLTHGIKELYSAEQQQLRVLTSFLRVVSTPTLRQTLRLHLHETRVQVSRLERVFNLLEEPIRWARCPGVQGILEECQGALEDHESGPVLDAALVATAQRLDYYEMAAYGSAAGWAEALDLPDVAALLQASLDEEVASADQLLAAAIDDIHDAAAHAPRQPDSRHLSARPGRLGAD
jgi:ferritin-like metal-binding protein YciE